MGSRINAGIFPFLNSKAVRFVQGLFIEHYDPTIEDSYRKSVQIPIGKDEEDHPILKKRTLEILDTAGTDQFAAMRELYLKNGDAFMLVYSITSASSFHELTAFHEQILRIKNASEVKRQHSLFALFIVPLQRCQ